MWKQGLCWSAYPVTVHPRTLIRRVQDRIQRCLSANSLCFSELFNEISVVLNAQRLCVVVDSLISAGKVCDCVIFSSDSRARVLYRRLKAGFSVCWQLVLTRQFVCLSLREFWLRLNEMHKVWTFAPRKAFLLLCGFCFSSLENYFGLGTTNVKGKTDHSVSLRWNKEFWTFPKRRVFFWLFIRFICELISPSFAGLN